MIQNIKNTMSVDTNDGYVIFMLAIKATPRSVVL